MCYLLNTDHNSMAVRLTKELWRVFKKCCIFNTVDGTDDMLWNGSAKDGDVWSECEEEEHTDCEDGDSDTDW